MSKFHTFPSQADDWQTISTSNDNAGKQAGVKKLEFKHVLALPSSKATKVYLTWRSCLACWDSTMDASTHTGETAHTSHTYVQQRPAAAPGRSESTGSKHEGNTPHAEPERHRAARQPSAAGARPRDAGERTASTAAATRARVKSRQSDSKLPGRISWAEQIRQIMRASCTLRTM